MRIHWTHDSSTDSQELALMTQADQNSTPFLNLRKATAIFVWAGVLLGVLSIANIPGNWGEPFCGVWGCGPPLQALLSCHLAWFVALTPLAFMVGPLSQMPTRLRRYLGHGLVLFAVAAIVGVAVHERLTWWPDVSNWQREFYWRRCGFVIITSVDLPLLQLLVTGILIILRGRRPSHPPEESSTSPMGY